MPVVNDATALQGGSYWNGIEVTGRPVIVTYSFPTTAPGYIDGVGGFTGATVSSFQAFTPAMQAQARSALAEWAAASGLVFLEVAPGQGDINFQLVDFNTTSEPSYAGSGGIAFYPFGDWNSFTYPYFTTSLDASGDVFMNTQSVSADQVDYGTLLHEIGHAIGLKHPTEVVFNGASGVLHDQVLAADDPSLTIMATVGESEGGTPTLKQLDKDVAAALYGPAGTGGVHATSDAGANSVSTWSFDAPSQTVTQTGFGTNDVIRGTSVADLINGGDGADILFGLGGNDTLNGGAGKDKLFGGQGVNQLAGGQGDDLYVLENAAESVIENLNEGNEDIVMVSFSYTLPANVEQLLLFGVGLIGTGNNLANSISGDVAGSSTLLGMAGNDYLVGGGSDDVFDGGTEADSMYGRKGNDSYFVDNVGDYVREEVDEGIDGVTSTISYTLTNNVENLILGGTAAINGTGNGLDNVLTGNGMANRINGGAGNDTLIGGLGNDSLNGGSGSDSLVGGVGNDTYVVDNSGDIIIENSNEGADLVQSSVTYSLASVANVEKLTLTGSGAISGTGNTLANTLTGNSGANGLDGGDGNDTLSGGSGNDTLIGGLGNDSLNGGSGNDALIGGTGDDIYVVDRTGDLITENADEGTDLVQSSITWSLGGNLEKLTLTGSGAISGTGNTLANTLTGNTGANVLNGGDGNDTLSGGSGNDTLIGGFGNDQLTGGKNSDRFVFGAELNDGVADTDTITDFTNGVDLVQVGIVGGTFANNIFSLGSNQYAIDWDGIGTGDAYQDIIQSNVALAATNFLFV